MKNVISSEDDFNQLYGMKVFSDWIKINDYHKYENLYLNSENNIIFLDFDVAFSSSNGSFDIPKNYDWGEMMSHQAPFWEGLTENLQVYNEWFDKIRKISEKDIRNIIQKIPSIWEVPELYQNSLVEFLLSNREKYISEFTSAFQYRNEDV